MWSGAYRTKIMDFGEDNLAVYNSADGLLHYPLGAPVAPEKLYSLAMDFRRAGLLKADYLYNVPPNYVEMFPDAREYFNIAADPADADYIYSIENIMEMRGARLRKKRNHIKHFEENFPDFETEEITPENVAAAGEFIREMDAGKGLEKEALAADVAVRHFAELGLRGLTLKDGSGKTLALAVFSALNSDIFTIHFEKSHHEAAGAPQMMVKLEAEALSALGAKFMNREQDLGDEHLRQAKSSLDPIRMYRRERAYLKL